ncbi:MAG: hypothetical protein J0M30_14235 [Chitinophagales bacterium]|nr:hypothetical protein [Chitinophagales bacterium]
MDINWDRISQKMRSIGKGMLRVRTPHAKETYQVEIACLQNGSSCVPVTLTLQLPPGPGLMMNVPASLIQITENGYLYAVGRVTYLGRDHSGDQLQVLMRVDKAHWFLKTVNHGLAEVCSFE